MLGSANDDSGQAKREPVSCFLSYEIDPAKLNDFEVYAKKWIRLVERLGGEHLGYFMPSEGASDRALALFDFPSLADYERYRQASFADAECLEAFAFAEKTACIRRYDRSFFRRVL